MAEQDPQSERDDGRSDAVAVALALAVGALFAAVALYVRGRPVPSNHRSASSSNGSSSIGPTAAEELRRQSRIRAFIANQVAARDIVLFVSAVSASSESSYAHFQRLFDVIFPVGTAKAKVKVTVAVVDLATTAQGKKILEELQELPLTSSPRLEHGSKQQQKQMEFFFVKGVLMGDYSHVKQLLVSGSLASELATQGVACDLTGIRVARHSDAGFIVLGPQHCFQTVSSSSSSSVSDEDSAAPRLETRPLDTVEELLSADAVALLLPQPPRVPLAERARNPLRRSKLLVCHDMKGGYLSDRFTQGSADFDAYRFYQWDLVDLFVYFGHHLVCIPPVGWIVAGHRNGTRVLGAFVTEGDRGAALSAQVFQTQACAEACAHKLAAIAAHQGFDGYLVNIENSVDKELLANVYAFLKALSAQLKSVNPDAQVIWYASLRRDGRKKHQMRLDTDGVPFFRCVDGFFTDYGWTVDDAKYSAAFDLDRRFDVFMGVDVFGRHDTLGGGELNCDVPLRTAWNAGVSAALFAPGWTHECLQHEADSEEDDFVAVEERFWTKIRSVWKARSPSFNVFGGRDSLYSAFNAGRGKSVWVDGVQQQCGKTKAWSNLLEMDQQPVAALHAGVTVQTRAATLRAVLSHETAFQGGTCVSIQGDMGGKDKAYVKLFDVDMELSARRITEISYTTSQQTDGSVALLVLTVVPGLDRPAHQVILRSSEDNGGENGSEPSSALSGVVGQSPGKHFYSPVWTREYSSSDGAWVKKTYRLGGMIWDQKHIVEIGVLCTKKQSNNNTSGAALDRKYHACVGEVCVVGNADVRSRTSLGTIAAEPKRCANARATEFRRLDGSSVAFRVHWQLAEESGGEPVQHVLVFLRETSGFKKRMLLGKSFGLSFEVERCLWKEAEDGEEDSTSLLHLELVSVSWTGAGASADGCNVYVDEESCQ